MTKFKPDLMPRTYPREGGGCPHGVWPWTACKDCTCRTWLASLGWHERSVAELPPYGQEMLGTDWSQLTIAGQRDELLAAVAYLMPMVRQSEYVGSRWVGYRHLYPAGSPLRERYGIGKTKHEITIEEDHEAAAEDATWD